MRRLCSVLVTISGLLALWPGTAQAGWKLQRSIAIADTVWHHPCGKIPVEITWGPQAPGVTASVLDSEKPPYPRCHVSFDSGEHLGFVELCSYMIHEYGHLANFQDPLNKGPGWSETEHSHNPDSIMAEFFDNDRRCRKRGRPYLLRHGYLSD